MSVASDLLFHPQTQARAQSWRGFCWPALFFNGFWAIGAGMPILGLMTLALTVLTGGLAWLVFPFVANDLRTTELLGRGFVVRADTREIEPTQTLIAVDVEPVSNPTASSGRDREGRLATV